jgi:hypothetical protein
MTEPTSIVLVALIGAIPTTLAVVLTARAQGKKTDKQIEKSDAIAKIAVGVDGEAAKKLQEVHVLVNSGLSNERAAKERAESRVRELEAIIVEKDKRLRNGHLAP